MQVLYTIGVRLVHLWKDEILNFVHSNDKFIRLIWYSQEFQPSISKCIEIGNAQMMEIA